MKSINKKLLSWLLICFAVFFAHIFLGALLHTEFRKPPTDGEVLTGYGIIVLFLCFPLSVLIPFASTGLSHFFDTNPMLFLSLFFVFVGTLNWIILILIIKRYSLFKTISLCLLAGILVAVSTIAIDSFLHEFAKESLVFSLCMSIYWGFWIGFVLSVIIRVYKNWFSLPRKQ